MRARLVPFALVLVMLGGCERSFDEKYEDNLKALNQEAAAIKADADKQIDAREAADAALGQGGEQEPPR